MWLYIYVIFKIFITHFILYIFKTIYNFKVKWSINKYSTHNIEFKKTYTTIAGINYKEQYWLWMGSHDIDELYYMHQHF